MITLIYSILHLKKLNLKKKKKKEKNGNKIRRDPHKIAHKVPNVLIAYFVMFYK